ncbi:MAG: S26 family signal peptidase [Planctomycetes bacterium]|nr:S26 family signal peptidase [Planctomycetota bacterium]
MLLGTSLRAALATWLTSLVIGGAGVVCVGMGAMLVAAETFVVPTGAMAPTIIGAHSKVECRNCAYGWDVSMSDRAAYAGFGQSPQAKQAICPNCGFAHTVPADSEVLSGDRIVVDKLSPPARWDVTVFRYPLEPNTNYVKRLVGMPGETVEIALGDLFVNDERLVKGPGEVLDLWLPVHDTTFRPSTPVDGGPLWRAEPGAVQWKETGGGWTVDATDDRTATIFFDHTIDDRLGYNAAVPWNQDQLGPPPAEHLPVGDVKIECELSHFSGEGDVSLLWRFARRTVSAVVSRSGEVELLVSPDAQAGGQPERASGSLDGPLRGGTSLTLAVRDGRCYVLQAGRVVVDAAVFPTDLAAARRAAHSATDASGEPCRLSIRARDCSVDVERIRIWRDVYYLTLEEFGQAFSAGPRAAANPLQLGDGQYLMLGDNSRQSQDGRFFGPVEEELLIGKARWIWWPRERWNVFD